jgi:hypothetical protein
MAHTGWETKLITKAINKTFCHETQHPARRKNRKARQDKLKSEADSTNTKKQ